VAIEFTVRNAGPGPSSPTEAAIQAAPLGAFVAWRPLGRVAVPALEPGEEVVLRTRATCDPPAPPTQVRPDRTDSALRRIARDLFDRRRPEPRFVPWSLGVLPGDPLRALGLGSIHWAGNLNIFVGRTPMERHMAMALAVRPGRPNMATFFVGLLPDAYRFRFEGEAAAWDAKLLPVGPLARMLGPMDHEHGDRPVPLDEWVELPGTVRMTLAFEPPPDCRAGNLDVHVEQRSTGKEAIVEFGFDPEAEGPGCYVL
jgi:hypothetical protein